MGATQSTPGSPAGSSSAKVAFNVLKIAPGSPAAKAGLIQYFDYIVAVNGVTVVQEMPNVVAEMAKTHVDKPMRLTVYNARNDTVREATIRPSDKWGGDGLLGCSIRFTTYERAIDRIWRILDTAPDSPGFKAGLVPHKDWIIGSVDLAVRSDEDFYQLLIHNVKRPVRLIVFNIDSNACREVTVVPNFDLGCDIGAGVLNRIPAEHAGVIANAAAGDRDSLLAGKGPFNDLVDLEERPTVPGRPVVSPSPPQWPSVPTEHQQQSMPIFPPPVAPAGPGDRPKPVFSPLPVDFAEAVQTDLRMETNPRTETHPELETNPGLETNPIMEANPRMEANPTPETNPRPETNPELETHPGLETEATHPLFAAPQGQSNDSDNLFK